MHAASPVIILADLSPKTEHFYANPPTLNSRYVNLGYFHPINVIGAEFDTAVSQFHSYTT